MNQVINKKMACLIAPDGTAQTPTLADDLVMCMAIIRLLAASGIGKEWPELIAAGYKILPVWVSITVKPHPHEPE